MTVTYLRQGERFGTGFFVLADHPFLVTADHVANFLNVSSSITVRGTNDTPINLKFADLVPDAQRLMWERHHENDLAVLRLKSTDQLGFFGQAFFSDPAAPFPRGDA